MDARACGGAEGEKFSMEFQRRSKAILVGFLARQRACIAMG